MKRRIEAVTLDQEEKEKRKRMAAEGGDGEGKDEEDDKEEEAVNEQDELDEIERKLRDHEAWLERERQAKNEFEAKQKKQAEEEETRRAEEELRREAQATQLRVNEAAIEAARSMNAAAANKRAAPTDLTDPNNCEFYMRTGACRYGEVCKKLHPEIEVRKAGIVSKFLCAMKCSSLHCVCAGVHHSFTPYLLSILRSAPKSSFPTCSTRPRCNRSSPRPRVT